MGTQTVDVASLRLSRLAHRLTQAEVAAACGISQSTLSNIERGHTLPTDSRLRELAELVGISPLNDEDTRWPHRVSPRSRPARADMQHDSGPSRRGGLVAAHRSPSGPAPVVDADAAFGIETERAIDELIRRRSRRVWAAIMLALGLDVCRSIHLGRRVMAGASVRGPAVEHHVLERDHQKGEADEAGRYGRAEDVA